MILEVGKKYKTNCGDIIDVVAALKSPLLDSEDVVGIRTFSCGRQTTIAYRFDGTWNDGTTLENNIALEAQDE